MNRIKSYFFIALIFTATFNAFAQTTPKSIDTLEFQIGYPFKHAQAIDQLKSFPSPRYQPNNTFIRIFNWMNPDFMGGLTQDGVTEVACIKMAEKIQEELIFNWNYFLLFPNSTNAEKSEWLDNPNSKVGSFIKLANKYPQIPLGITTFWCQLEPQQMGFKNNKPFILYPYLPKAFKIKNDSGRVIKDVINFAAPDSLFIKDGRLQQICIQNIVKHLKRPINFISENGEEPPRAYETSLLSEDKDMIADKNKLGIEDWHLYISQKKKHFRNLYSSQFMNTIPELKNTIFTFYCVEGGPVDRFDWESTKASCSKIKGNYYSTPDFYTRFPNNWKDRTGAWHGWKWINDGRKVEIKSGDRFFSPFISAGWDYNPENDIRPAQWLGLLKCLSVVGAEFYYSCYFNLKQPFTKPEDYVWQAAMPAYSQAITTHYADVFFKGNVLFDSKNEPIITYPVSDSDVLVAVRKHSTKNKYVIAGTVQPSSNTERYPLQKNIEIKIDNETLLLNVRRQGSVYVYDKSVTPPIFYQLDRWHQYEHPMRWRKYWINEAEVFDTACVETSRLIKSDYTKTNTTVDFVSVRSYISLNIKQWVSYTIYSRDLEHLKTPTNLMLYIKSKDAIKLNVITDGITKAITHQATKGWEWVIVPFELNTTTTNNITMKLESITDGLEIDKLILIDSATIPDLKNY